MQIVEMTEFDGRSLLGSRPCFNAIKYLQCCALDCPVVVILSHVLPSTDGNPRGGEPCLGRESRIPVSMYLLYTVQQPIHKMCLFVTCLVSFTWSVFRKVFS